MNREAESPRPQRSNDPNARSPRRLSGKLSAIFSKRKMLERHYRDRGYVSDDSSYGGSISRASTATLTFESHSSRVSSESRNSLRSHPTLKKRARLVNSSLPDSSSSPVYKFSTPLDHENESSIELTTAHPESDASLFERQVSSANEGLSRTSPTVTFDTPAENSDHTNAGKLDLTVCKKVE